MNYKVIPILFALAFLLVPPMSSYAVSLVESGDLYSCDNPPSFVTNPSFSRRIHLLNQTDLSVISSQNVIISGLPEGIDENGDYSGCNGLTVDPTDGQMYMLLSLNVDHPFTKFNEDRWLATIDPTTGIGTAVGNWGEGVGVTYPFGTIAFNSTGHLHGMINSDIGFPTASQYFFIDKSTAEPTLLCDLGIGDVFYQQIAYNYDNDKMYFIQGAEGFDEGELHSHYNVNVIDITEPDCLVGTWNGNIGNYEGMGGGESSHDTGTEVQGTAYNTNDGLFWALDGYNVVVANLNNTGLNKYDPTDNLTGFVSNTYVNIANGVSKGLAFVLNLIVSDSTPPVISAIGSEPIKIIQDSTFLPFENVQCIDDVDGNITNNMDYSPTPDTSVRGLVNVDYQCIDSSSNQADETIQYLIQKKSSGSGGGSSSLFDSLQPLSFGNQEPIPKLEDIPPLVQSPQSQVSDEPRFFERLFADLFQNRLGVDGERVDQGIGTAQQAVQTGQQAVQGFQNSQASIILQDIFDRIFSFFR